MFIDKVGEMNCLAPEERNVPFGKPNVSLLTERAQDTFQLSWPINISPLMGRRPQPPKIQTDCCANSSNSTLVFTGHLPLDASIGNQPHDGYKDIKKARDPRTYKGHGIATR